MHRHRVEILCASIRVWYGRVVADESAARRLITCYDMTCHYTLTCYILLVVDYLYLYFFPIEYDNYITDNSFVNKYYYIDIYIYMVSINHSLSQHVYSSSASDCVPFCATAIGLPIGLI